MQEMNISCLHFPYYKNDFIHDIAEWMEEKAERKE